MDINIDAVDPVHVNWWTVNFDHNSMASNCYPVGTGRLATCQVSVAFTNFREGEHTATTMTMGNPFPQGKVRMEVFTTDPELRAW